MKLSREAIQRMVGDRVGGGGGAGGGGGISMDDIQGMGFATQQWVGENYLSIAFFSSLFKAYTSQMVEVVPNGGDVSTIENIKAMFGFWTEQYVSSLGYNSSGGGGGGSDLKLLLDNINDSNIGNIAPTANEVGKCLVYNGNNTWAWATPGGGGGGGGTGTVTSITAGTGLSGGTITTSGTIAISSTYQTYISDGETAYGWGNHANAGYLTQSSLNGYATQQWADQRYVTIGTQQDITAQKTFKASLIASNEIYLNKRYQQQWVNFNNQTKNFSFGQELGGDCVLYSGVPDDVDKIVNFYTNINGNHYSLFVQGSSGNVGIGTNAPAYKFDVSGNVHTNSGYYIDSKLLADSNNGLNIGHGFAAADLPTTLWGDEISFRSIDGTYGECTTIKITNGYKYGIMGTDFIGVTNKFRFEYDLRNNTVWVLKADGSAVHFASLGGVSSLGTSSSGTPNISSMNLDLLTATTGTIDTLTATTGTIDLLTATTGTIDLLTATELKVGGSSASSVKKIYWDGTYLQVQIGTTTYKFRPDATA